MSVLDSLPLHAIEPSAGQMSTPVPEAGGWDFRDTMLQAGDLYPQIGLTEVAWCGPSTSSECRLSSMIRNCDVDPPIKLASSDDLVTDFAVAGCMGPGSPLSPSTNDSTSSSYTTSQRVAVPSRIFSLNHCTAFDPQYFSDMGETPCTSYPPSPSFEHTFQLPIPDCDQVTSRMQADTCRSQKVVSLHEHVVDDAHILAAAGTGDRELAAVSRTIAPAGDSIAPVISDADPSLIVAGMSLSPAGTLMQLVHRETRTTTPHRTATASRRGSWARRESSNRYIGPSRRGDGSLHEFLNDSRRRDIADVTPYSDGYHVDHGLRGIVQLPSTSIDHSPAVAPSAAACRRSVPYHSSWHPLDEIVEGWDSRISSADTSCPCPAVSPIRFASNQLPNRQELPPSSSDCRVCFMSRNSVDDVACDSADTGTADINQCQDHVLMTSTEATAASKDSPILQESGLSDVARAASSATTSAGGDPAGKRAVQQHGWSLGAKSPDRTPLGPKSNRPIFRPTSVPPHDLDNDLGVAASPLGSPMEALPVRNTKCTSKCLAELVPCGQHIREKSVADCGASQSCAVCDAGIRGQKHETLPVHAAQAVTSIDSRSPPPPSSALTIASPAANELLSEAQLINSLATLLCEYRDPATAIAGLTATAATARPISPAPSSPAIQVPSDQLGDPQPDQEQDYRCFEARGPRPLLQVLLVLESAGVLTASMLAAVLLQFLPTIFQRVQKKASRINKAPGVAIAAKMNSQHAGLYNALINALRLTDDVPDLARFGPQFRASLCGKPGAPRLGTLLLSALQCFSSAPFTIQARLMEAIAPDLLPHWRVLLSWCASKGVEAEDTGVTLRDMTHWGTQCRGCGLKNIYGPCFHCATCASSGDPTVDFCGPCSLGRSRLHDGFHAFRCLFRDVRHTSPQGTAGLQGLCGMPTNQQLHSMRSLATANSHSHAANPVTNLRPDALLDSVLIARIHQAAACLVNGLHNFPPQLSQSRQCLIAGGAILGQHPSPVKDQDHEDNYNQLRPVYSAPQSNPLSRNEPPVLKNAHRGSDGLYKRVRHPSLDGIHHHHLHPILLDAMARNQGSQASHRYGGAESVKAVCRSGISGARASDTHKYLDGGTNFEPKSCLPDARPTGRLSSSMLTGSFPGPNRSREQLLSQATSRLLRASSGAVDGGFRDNHTPSNDPTESSLMPGGSHDKSAGDDSGELRISSPCAPIVVTERIGGDLTVSFSRESECDTEASAVRNTLLR